MEQAVKGAVGARSGRAAGRGEPAFPSAQLPAVAGASIAAAIAALVSMVLGAGLFLRLMNYEMRRDEELYVSPARLLDTQSPYTDFFYNHTPGSAWWFHGIRQGLGSDFLLFDGRLGVFAAWLLFAASIGALAYVVTRSAAIAASIVVLSLVNELFLTQAGMSATNNFLPLPLSFLGLGLFVLAVGHERPRPGLAALAGFFLALAAVFKISAVAFVVPAAIGAFVVPTGWSFAARLRGTVLPLGLGGLLGGLPILYYLATDPARFLANVVLYHLGPHAQYFRSGASPDEDAVTTLAGKLVLAHDLWLGGAVAVALAALGLIVILWFRDGHASRRQGPAARPALALFVLGAFCVAALVAVMPTPSFPQYFGPPLICLPLALIVLTGALSPAARAQARLALIAASIVVVAIQAPRLVQNLGLIASPGRWTVTRVHESGVDIARRLQAAGLEGKVATLAPLYPLEGGLPVYAELATGLFAYRTADTTTLDLAAYYRMTSPTKVAGLLDADPPAALLLGFEPDLERPMLDYAMRNGYAPAPGFQVTDRYGTALLYLKPAR